MNEEKFDSGFDIVVVARVNARDATYKEIESALLHVAGLHRNVLV